MQSQCYTNYVLLMEQHADIARSREYQETGWQKVSRKLKEEPLIPLGEPPTSNRAPNGHISSLSWDSLLTML